MKIPKWALVSLIALLPVAVWNVGQMHKRLAKVEYVLVSPAGCYRLVGLTPRWLLPAPFHPMPDVGDPQAPDRWLEGWEVPRFFRLYDQRNDRLLHETLTYDLAMTTAFKFPWYEPRDGRLITGMIDLGPALPDCVEAPPPRNSWTQPPPVPPPADE